jgi:hypothetical protein
VHELNLDPKADVAMKQKRLFLFFFVLLLAGVACGGQAEEPTVVVEQPTTIPTPTLAPTATSDPNASTVGTGPDDPSASSTTVPEVSGGGATPTGDAGTSTDGTDEGAGGEGSDGGDGGTAAVTCPAGGTDLLTNGGFEGQFEPFGAFVELNRAKGWFPWWKDGESNLRPEFKPAEIATAPNRIHGGSTAQQYFKSHGMFKAGLYQPVLNIQPGVRLQFSAYGQAWSCQEFSMCPDATSVNPAKMLMRVGIDPTGATHFEANTVVWSEYFNPLDQFQVACIEAVAQADKVTVYLWASPDGPRQNQDIYWDDAKLVILP